MAKAKEVAYRRHGQRAGRSAHRHRGSTATGCSEGEEAGSCSVDGRRTARNDRTEAWRSRTIRSRRSARHVRRDRHRVPGDDAQGQRWRSAGKAGIRDGPRLGRGEFVPITGSRGYAWTSCDRMGGRTSATWATGSRSVRGRTADGMDCATCGRRVRIGDKARQEGNWWRATAERVADRVCDGLMASTTERAGSRSATKMPASFGTSKRSALR